MPVGAIVAACALLYVLAHVASVAIETRAQRACGACHAMEPWVESHRRSRHQGVPCLRCHGDRGPAGFTALWRVGRCAAYRLGWRAPLVGAPDREGAADATCLSCHRSDWRVLQRSPDRFTVHPHGSCRSCHRGMAHGPRTGKVVEGCLGGPGRDLGAFITQGLSRKRHFQGDPAAAMAFCDGCHRSAVRPDLQAGTLGSRCRLCHAASAGHPDGAGRSGARCMLCHVRY